MGSIFIGVEMDRDKHIWLNLYRNGVWTGREDRMVTLADGSEHNIDELAKQHGFELPDSGSKPKAKSKKTINTDVEEKRYEDMDGTHDSGDTEVDDRRDSQSEE